jgi:hypothetical protein
VRRITLKQITTNTGFLLVYVFRALFRNYEKRILASSGLSYRLSVRTEQFGSHWTDFYEVRYVNIFPKICPENLSFIKIWQDKRHFTWCPRTFIIISRCILLRMRNVSKDMKEKNTFCVQWLLPEKSCRLWDNVDKYGTARQAKNDNVIRHMRFEFWITKATDTLLSFWKMYFFRGEGVVQN